MQQQDYFIRIIEEFMAAVTRFLEKAEGKRNDDELRDLYRQYVGDYELLRNMTVEEAIGYAHEQWAAGQRMQKLEMLAELLYAEGSYKQSPFAGCCSTRPSASTTMWMVTAATSQSPASSGSQRYRE